MEKGKLKGIIKIIIGCFIFWTIVFSIFMIESFKEFFFPMLQIVVGFIVILFIPYIIENLKKRGDEIKSDDYYRDIISNITPAMGALIIDKYLEKNEAVLSTILDLSVRKYLDIKKENDKLEIEVLDKNTDELYLHEKYIMESIKENNLIQLAEFKRLVEKDCRYSEYTKHKNVEPTYIIIFCLTIWGIFLYPALADSILNRNVMKFSFITLISILLIFFPTKIITTGQNRTNKGDVMAKRIKELKNYLKDYTLLKDRDINYLILADRYLPFALALGEAKKIESLYITHNDLLSKYVEKEEQI